MLRIIFLIVAAVIFIPFEANVTHARVQIIDANERVKASYNVEIADTDALRVAGLMYREFLDKDAGMLFIFDRAEADVTFWMKNTLIPLDMIFVNDQKQIIHIEHKALPHDLTSRGPSQGLTRYVLEVNGGQAEKNRIEVGDRLAISHEDD